MAQWALQFTPDVCLGQWHDTVLLEVGPSLRLWGGLEPLLGQLTQGWQRLGWPPKAVQMQQAHTARLAEWLLQSPIAKGQTHRIPLSSIFEAHPHLDRLARMGIRDLGPVLKLPRAGLRQRFGAGFVAAIEAALGERADPRQAIHAPAIFEQGLELALPTDSKGLLETGCLRLLEEGLAWLAGMQAAVTEYRFVFHQGRRQSQELCIGLAEPSREASRIQRLLSESLSQTALTAAVSGIALRLDNPLPLAHHNEELFPQSNPARENQGIQELCERLSARLGQSQVLRIQEINSHRPEAASQLIPWKENQKSGPAAKSPTLGLAQPMASQPPRPIWLLESPVALSVQKERPIYQGPLRLRAGPERIESDWWSDPFARDYFVAETNDQRLVWVFRTPGHDWFLHGFFG